MVSEIFDGRGQDGGSPKQRILVPLAQVEDGANLVVARSVGEYTPNPNVPHGYSLHPEFSHLRIEIGGNGRPHALVSPRGESILLTNRYFDQTDLSLNGYLSHGLNRLGNSEAESVSILEIGGGNESTCAVQIGAGDNRFQVTNVDILLKDTVEAWGPAPRNVRPILGDARNLPVPDGSQDLVYSSRLLMYLEEEDFIAAFREIVRVMKTGGEAVLFDFPYEGGRTTRLTQRLSWELGVDVFDWDLESDIGIGYVLLVSKPEKTARQVPVGS